MRERVKRQRKGKINKRVKAIRGKFVVCVNENAEKNIILMS